MCFIFEGKTEDKKEKGIVFQVIGTIFFTDNAGGRDFCKLVGMMKFKFSKQEDIIKYLNTTAL